MGMELSEHKKMLFRRLQQQTRQQAARAPGVCPRADRATCPLSFAQQRLWLLEHLSPGSPARRVTLALHLEGTLHSEVLRQCLQELPRRHEPLRATFTPAEHSPGAARQTPVPAGEVPLRVQDLRGQVPEGEQAWVEAHRRLRACGPDACDLARGPLLAGTLLRLDEDRCLLGLSSHAIVADHASLALLARELLCLYAGVVGGQSVSLPHLPLSYADYAAWEQQRLTGQGLAGLQEYWRQALGAVPLTLNLPFDAYRPAGGAPCPAEQVLTLDRELVSRARAFCSEEDLPLPYLLYGAFALLLRQYTGQRELLLGYLDSERAPELSGLVGPLTAALPVRVCPAGQATGRAFLRELGQNLARARAHRDLPLERIVEVVAPQHDLSRLPFFQASVACYRLPPCGAAGLTAQMVPLCAAPDALACIFVDDGQGVQFTLAYDSTLFAAPSIARLQEHSIQMLQTLLQHLDEPLASLTCLTAGERVRLLQDWNAVPAAPLPLAGHCLHQLVEQQVRRTPQAIALSDGLRCLTYGQLNARANRLARVLRHRGVGPEDLVGLCLPRSPDLVVGLLAILKAGAAYVPLDPAYPRERLALTIEDASLALVLTERGQRLPISAQRTLCLEDVALCGVEGDADDDDCPWARDSAQVAYVIYTSGSTGRPKGVCITHRSAVQFLHWTREQFTDDELAGVLCGTSLCFDLSIFEIFAPLCRGGRVVLAASALELPRLAVCETITLLNTVPSAAAALLGSGPLPASVQTVNLAGEALTRDLVQALSHQPGVRRVCNLYGPTEDTTYSTWTMTRADEQGPVPIGAPLPGTQAYILDEQLRLAPIGIVGELYLGGEGLARGYLRRPDLTAERFLPDHVSGVPGRRLYRTGDLARYRADGVIDYLGRIDHQVKIRGFRVELGEIEARLRQQQEVAEAVVLARRAAGAEQSLVAYVVPRPEAEARPDPALLRRSLQDVLPAYMIPSFFVILARLPLTPNGKVDRRALPAPDPAGEAVDLSADGREQWLARLWQELFPRSQLRRHADFFALGGASLHLMRLLARLHRHGQTHLGPGDLYTAPTIAAQALLLRAPAAAPDDLGPGTGGGMACEEPVPLSFAQQHIWTQDQLIGSPGVYHVPLILALSGALDALALYQALYEVMRRHDALRACVRLLRGSPVLAFSPTPVPDLASVDLPLAAEAALAPEDLDTHPQVQRAIQAEIMRPFNLSAGPLLRVRLLRVQRDHTILVCTLHQFVIDDWSLHLFWQELVELYNAFRAGRPSPLAQPGLQYREMIAWQQARWPVHGPGDLACWRERLTPLPPALALPTDAQRPAVQTCEGATFHARIPPALVRRLHATGRREGATLFMLLLTAFLLHLARCSGQEDLVVGTAVAGRPRPEMERMIGLCTHALPLRITLAGCANVRDLLGRVRTAVLSACEHQAPSLEQLIEALRPQTDPSRAPLFQVFFAQQYASPAEMRLAGLTTRRLELWPPTSEFDLSCLLEERPYGLNMTLRYSTRLFTRATIERFQEQYQELVQGLCTLLDSPIQAICGPAALALPVAWEAGEEAEVGEQGEEARGEKGILLQGPLEETLAAIWQTVLGRTGLARSEHFFEIGGHSLLAMQVLVAVREQLQVTLTLRQFFDAPTLAELARLVEQARAGQQASAERLLPVARNRQLPLSFAQQRLWFLDQLEGASATYTMPVVLRLSGQLDLPVFQRSLHELARRHEALRTTFVQEQGRPVQCIHRLPFPVLSVVDAPAGATARQRQQALFAQIEAEVRRPFDLASGPLLRVRVLCLEPDEQIVVFTMHHIISDGWSLGIMARELGALYNAFRAGRPSPLPELPIQYADFAAWQQASVQGPRLAASLRYWEQRLRGAPTLQLPTDHPRQASATLPGATCASQWPKAFTQELLEFSTRRGLTLFMTLLAGFLALLSYHSGQEDITVGTPVANRPHPDLERLVGLFVNTLALRLDLAGDPGGHELCQRVREMTLDACEHQDAPFEQIVEAIRPGREPGRTPVFQVMFAFQNAPTASLELSGLQVHSVDTHTSTAKFDLSVSLEMHDEGLVVGTEYSTQLFEAATIRRFHQQYRVLLERLIRHPQQPLSWVYRGLAGPDASSTREEQHPCSPTSGMISNPAL